MFLTWNPSTKYALRLREILRAATARPGEADWYGIPEGIRNLAADNARAVVGYGSWYEPVLRKPESFPDLYLVVDCYTRYHHNAFHAWMNRVLPPNVYFLWDDRDGRRRVRGKYNVISSGDLERECGPDLRDLYNAGRLTKLVWIAWVRDAPTREWLLDRLSDAHTTLTPLVLGLLPEQFALDEFSLELLALSYRAEPRLEGWERIRALHAARAGYYREVHGVLLEAFIESTGLIEPGAGAFRKLARRSEWEALAERARRLVRRSRRRGYVRWPRIILTEPNLVDLAASEAERKAGVSIRITPQLRRHPLIYGLPEYLRVFGERKTVERMGRRPTPLFAAKAEAKRSELQAGIPPPASRDQVGPSQVREKKPPK